VKRRLYIFIILTGIYGLDVSAEKADTSNLSLPVDTVFVPAIQYDSATYQQFKENKIYDYHQTKPKGASLWDIFWCAINRFLNDRFTETQIKIVLWALVVVVVVILLLILYYFKPSWFYVNKKNKMDFDVENENIHELDFERLINDALQSGQYATAIRWNYLQTLKALHSKELISWDTHKTVIEYVYEIKRPALKSSFKEASQQFLYCRYGNFEASREDWEEFILLTNHIMKQI